MNRPFQICLHQYSNIVTQEPFISCHTHRIRILHKSQSKEHTFRHGIFVYSRGVDCPPNTSTIQRLHHMADFPPWVLVREVFLNQRNIPHTYLLCLHLEKSSRAWPIRRSYGPNVNPESKKQKEQKNVTKCPYLRLVDSWHHIFLVHIYPIEKSIYILSLAIGLLNSQTLKNTEMVNLSWKWSSSYFPLHWYDLYVMYFSSCVLCLPL